MNDVAASNRQPLAHVAGFGFRGCLRVFDLVGHTMKGEAMRSIAIIFVLLATGFVQAQEVPVGGPFIDRAIERIEARQTKAIEEVNAKIKIVDRLLGRVDVADKERKSLRESLDGLIESRKELAEEQTYLGGLFREIKGDIKANREENKTARQERAKARAEGESLIEKIADWNRNRQTLRGWVFWTSASFCASLLLLGGTVLLIFRMFPGVRRLILGV